MRKSERRLSMNQPAQREVLECASPLALSDLVRGRKSGRGLPQSKTLARLRPPHWGSWSQWKRKSETELSRKRLSPPPNRGKLPALMQQLNLGIVGGGTVG